MYYLRAKQGNTNSTTEALRKFYEKEYYKELKNESTLVNLKSLLCFWYDVNIQNKERFSDRVLKRLFVLNYAPNGMWYYIVSVYFMHHQEKNRTLDDSQFFNFLEKITAFIWAYALTNPGVNALRTPVYREMVNIINDKEVTFEDFKFDKNNFVSIFKNFKFLNQRQITRSMITWWAFHFKAQELLPIDCRLDIEHIYARNRMKSEPLSSEQDIDLLGNKSLLEQRINIRASDYRFTDKAKYYQGERGNKGATSIYELLELSRHSDFKEDEIIQRDKEILEGFLEFLNKNKLLK